MENQDQYRLEEQIKHGEGLRLTAYLDTIGILTIGYGHNCIVSPIPGVSRVGDRITKEQAEALFRADLGKSISNVRRALPWVDLLTPPRQAVIFDMGFNMGVGSATSGRGLLSFGNTLRQVEVGNYAQAAKNMMTSKWSRQVGDGPGGNFDRAERLAKQMETGEWQC